MAIDTQGTDVVLRGDAISKSYGQIRALREVDIDIRAGEIHALLGDNGAGKSTLIRILAGATSPDAGRILMDGVDVSFTNPGAAQRAGIETVYQDLALAPSLDASANIYLGREIMRRGLPGRLGLVDRKAMRRATSSHLSELGIALQSVGTPIENLSGGQRQAVAVARAAIWGQRVLILDEPTAALGVHQTGLVLDLMRTARDRGMAIVFISHNLPQVLEVADRVSVLHLGSRALSGPAVDFKNDDLVAAMSGFRSAQTVGG